MARQSQPPAFLLTRPAEQSHRLAEMLRATFGADARLIISPLIAPVFPAIILPEGRFHSLVLTSATAVAAIRRLPADQRERLPELAWCVGDQTASAATSAGFRARSAKGDAAALIAAILASGEGGRLLHLQGADTRGNVAESLISAGIDTVSLVIYEQLSQPLSPDAIAVLQGADLVIVPLFSPRTARIFSDALRDMPATAPLLLAALSPAVAAEIQVSQSSRLTIAAEPTARALIKAIADANDAGSRP